MILGGIGPTEIMLIFGVALLLFGATKLPQLAQSMGKSVGEFKKAQKQAELELKQLELEAEGQGEDEEEFEEEEEYEEEEESEELTKVQQLASNLDIEIEDKTDEELLEEIEAKTNPQKESTEEAEEEEKSE